MEGEDQPAMKTKAQKRRELKHARSKIANAIARLDRLNPVMSTLHPQNGDLLLINAKAEDLDKEMIQGFMSILQSRGVVVDVLVLQPGQSLEACTAEQFEKIAKMRDYVPEEAKPNASDDVEPSGTPAVRENPRKETPEGSPATEAIQTRLRTEAPAREDDGLSKGAPSSRL